MCCGWLAGWLALVGAIDLAVKSSKRESCHIPAECTCSTHRYDPPTDETDIVDLDMMLRLDNDDERRHHVVAPSSTVVVVVLAPLSWGGGLRLCHLASHPRRPPSDPHNRLFLTSKTPTNGTIARSPSGPSYSMCLAAAQTGHYYWALPSWIG
uniref:Secreted protein n=1 Tax=Haemonchus contortus TaxID=6289 RepID=A0A7I4Z3M7_HAECO